jgi:hypothetical protein
MQAAGLGVLRGFMVTEIRAVYLGEKRTEVSVGDRTCVLENLTLADGPVSALCPVELLGAAVAG